jgi:long-chain acyl-CoA synthetase
MNGYWSGAADPRGTIPAEGFRTGDLARVDKDGAIELMGRRDDILKIGGRKVNPREVEAVLNDLPCVREAAVVAIPDPEGILENVLHAFVVPRAGKLVQEPELLDRCRDNLEPYQIPARIRICESLPRSAVGKVLRRSLAANATG